MESNNDGWVFTALTLVDADGVGQFDIVDLIAAEEHRTAIKVHGKGAIGCQRNGSHITVKYVVVVVISQLDYSVTLSENSGSTFDGC